jgi:protein phosphatase 1D
MTFSILSLSDFHDAENWPKTTAGLPSTSGTTASVCFIMNNKVYSGHVGDSRIILARKNPLTKMWIPISLTEDHKPGSEAEKQRITDAGGEVMCKSGVDRVVWFRPKNGHRGPIRRSTNFDKIPFLAIARSLGDLWSYNPDNDTYVVSPDPDLHVMPLNPDEHKCLILASDGLWNMLLDYESVRLVQELREDMQPDLLKSLRNPKVKDSKNPSEVLVHYALQKWNSGHLRADNTSAVTLILNPVSTIPPTSTSSTPFCVTDENVSLIPAPTVLPVISEPAEFVIHAVDPKIERILPVVCEEKNFALLSPSMQSLCKFTESHAEVLSQTNTSSSSSTRESSSSPSRRFTFTVPAVSLSSKDTSPTVVADTNHIYINELPDESFEALSNALRLNNASSQPKVISGVTVISDFDEDSSRSDSSFDGKKNKSCSVTEALVDNVPDNKQKQPVEKPKELTIMTTEKVVSCKMLQELNGNTHQTHVSQKDENSSDKNNASPHQPSSSTESLSPSCGSSTGRKRKANNKWPASEPPYKKCLRSSRSHESRAVRFTRNMIRVAQRITKARPLRSRKISFYNKH